MNTRRSTRVAIVGGGCAGLTAAYELSQPSLAGEYDVTVYQMGWRLGGKGASSRGPFDRIEEHGIHLWMGCYENAFKMIRDVYAENEPCRGNSPIKTWRDAFQPVSHLGLGRWSPAAGWDIWSAYFPPQPGVPGDPIFGSAGGTNPFSIQSYLVHASSMLLTLVEHSLAPPSRAASAAPKTETEQNEWSSPENIVNRARRMLAGGVAALTSPTHLLDAARLQLAMFRMVLPESTTLGARLAALISEQLCTLIRPANVEQRDAMSVAEVAELIAVSIKGCLVDGVLLSSRGFESIDHLDFREWVQHHGASERCLASPFVRGMYSLTFAYEGGDVSRPRFAAGVFLRVCVRMFFTYRGALFWRMAAGMGEIVFSPLYEVLRARGVKFEFFHRLESVRLDEERGPAVSGTSRLRALEFAVQAQTRGNAEYEPLIDVGGLPCWPNTPLWEQLDTDAAVRQHAAFEDVGCGVKACSRTLHAGQDFDLAVLAIGLGAVPSTCAELIDRHPRWRSMVQQVKTVATQAFQLWLTPTLEELGWNRGPVMSTGFAPPFDSWGDMSNLVDWESWPKEQQPGTLSYFCNALPDRVLTEASTSAGRSRIRATVRANVVHYLDNEITAVWPNSAAHDGGFRWDMVTGPGLASAHHPVDTQYISANFNPSDRYTLSVPGSGEARISPLDRDCENLTVAGDWTACGIDVGCIEAAVMSGMLAAHALTGSTPSCEDIVGYHHP